MFDELLKEVDFFFFFLMCNVTEIAKMYYSQNLMIFDCLITLFMSKTFSSVVKLCELVLSLLFWKLHNPNYEV